MDQMQHLANQYADLERRLRQLEGGQRSGLSSIAADGGNAGFEITTFETVDYGGGWVDDAASGSTPQVTLETGSRVVIIATFRATHVGRAGSFVGLDDFRCGSLVAGVAIDGRDPHEFPAPSMRAAYDIGGADVLGSIIQVPATFVPTRSDLTPGEHTFTLRFSAYDTYPAGTVNPLITDTSLIVIPLGWG